MTDGKFAGNGITNGDAGRWQQRFAGSGESTDPGTESGDPGIKTGQRPRFSRRIRRSRAFDTIPRLSSGSSDFQALRLLTTGRLVKYVGAAAVVRAAAPRAAGRDGMSRPAASASGSGGMPGTEQVPGRAAS